MAYEIMSTREAANYLRVSPSTLEHMRIVGRGPKFFRIGRQVRYRLEDLERFAAEQIEAI
jgi:excisionase family DNA binding protein